MFGIIAVPGSFPVTGTKEENVTHISWVLRTHPSFHCGMRATCDTTTMCRHSVTALLNEASVRHIVRARGRILTSSSVRQLSKTANVKPHGLVMLVKQLICYFNARPVMACAVKVLRLSATSASLHLTYLPSQNRTN